MQASKMTDFLLPFVRKAKSVGAEWANRIVGAWTANCTLFINPREAARFPCQSTSHRENMKLGLDCFDNMTDFYRGSHFHSISRQFGRPRHMCLVATSVFIFSGSNGPLHSITRVVRVLGRSKTIVETRIVKYFVKFLNERSSGQSVGSSIPNPTTANNTNSPRKHMVATVRRFR